jgi:hypothetical protein
MGLFPIVTLTKAIGMQSNMQFLNEQNFIQIQDVSYRLLTLFSKSKGGWIEYEAINMETGARVFISFTGQSSGPRVYLNTKYPVKHMKSIKIPRLIDLVSMPEGKKKFDLALEAIQSNPDLRKYVENTLLAKKYSPRLNPYYIPKLDVYQAAAVMHLWSLEASPYMRTEGGIEMFNKVTEDHYNRCLSF